MYSLLLFIVIYYYNSSSSFSSYAELYTVFSHRVITRVITMPVNIIESRST